MWNPASTDMESESTAWNTESKTLLESEYPTKILASGSDQLNLSTHTIAELKALGSIRPHCTKGELKSKFNSLSYERLKNRIDQLLFT